MFADHNKTHLQISNKKIPGDFPVGPVVKNPLGNAGEVGSTPCLGARTPHTVEQLSPHATTRESGHCNERSHMMQQRPNAAK